MHLILTEKISFTKKLNHYRDPVTQLVSFATYLPLIDALYILKKYETKYNCKYCPDGSFGHMIQFRFLSVTNLVDPIPRDLLESLKVEFLDDGYLTTLQ